MFLTSVTVAFQSSVAENAHTSEAEWTYDHSMCCCRTHAPRHGLKALLDIHHQAPFDRRCVDPLAILSQNLQAAHRILREKREQSRRVLVRAHTDGTRWSGRILDEFDAMHSTEKWRERPGGERQRSSHVLKELCGKRRHSGEVFLGQGLKARAIWILHVVHMSGQQFMPSKHPTDHVIRLTWLGPSSLCHIGEPSVYRTSVAVPMSNCCFSS